MKPAPSIQARSRRSVGLRLIGMVLVCAASVRSHAQDVFACATTAQQLQDALTDASDGGANANFGMMFANKITVDCP